jgi:hypothetical protein
VTASDWLFLIALTSICLIGVYGIVGVLAEIERRRD